LNRRQKRAAFSSHRSTVFQVICFTRAIVHLFRPSTLDRLVTSVQKLGAADSGLVAWICRHYPLRGTLSAWGLAAALGVLALAGLPDRGRFMLFHLLELVLTALFIGATPQATGPHHPFMIQPFSQIVVARR
jgi:hypothetical protein